MRYPMVESGVMLAWAAGLFEGEGSIGLLPQRGRSGQHRYQYVQLQMTSTDEDTIRKFVGIVGGGHLNGPYDMTRYAGRETHKPQWRWSATHKQGREILRRLLPYLGERRRARAAEVFHGEGRVE